MSNKLNMTIARTHTLTSRLLGMQLTGGNLIGVGLSALQMSAGFLIIGGGVIAQNALLMGPLVFLVGIALAILVERLSLGGLSGMRVAKDDLKRIKELYFALEAPTDQQTAKYESQKEDLEKDRKTARNFAALGIVLSAGVGDVFWHFLFESLGWVGYILSVACAGVISLTFIHSELFKNVTDGVLRHILSDLNLMRVAVASEGANTELGMMVDAYSAVANDAAARQPVEDKMKKTILRRMDRYASRAASVADEVDALNSLGVNVVEGSISGISSVPQLALPAARGKYPQFRDELIRMLRSNPNLTQRDVADHFQISRSTASDWIANVRNGK